MEKKHVPEKDKKSKGHLGFFDEYEYFDRINAGVYKAHRSDVIMPDGYRTGRWEWIATRAHRQNVDDFLI